MIEELAPQILPVVLANIMTRYPYHDSHLALDGEPLHDPNAAHPAFGNSFDWHSSVHSHWTALHVIEHFSAREKPPDVAKLEEAVASNLRASHIEEEHKYLAARPSYERPYGWGWAMALAAAARRSSHPVMRESAASLRALGESIALRTIGWLDILPMPVRHGVHANTAFALGLMYDACDVLGTDDLRRAITAKAREWFATDRKWPVEFERSGNDFLSSGITEADLMRRVLPPNAFAAWWDAFLPSLAMDSPIVTPARFAEVDDGHVVHLHGLNLSRAAALARISRALQRPPLNQAAITLYRASVERATGGYYSETHWLPTFAWDAAAAIDGV